MVGDDFNTKLDEAPSLVETDGLLRATDVSEGVPCTTTTHAVYVSRVSERCPQRTHGDQRSH